MMVFSNSVYHKTSFSLHVNRDYFQEVLSWIDVALPNWSIKHLSVWSEIVDTQRGAISVDGITDVDLEAAQEATMAAKFQELRSKIAFPYRNST